MRSKKSGIPPLRRLLIVVIQSAPSGALHTLSMNLGLCSFTWRRKEPRKTHLDHKSHVTELMQCGVAVLGRALLHARAPIQRGTLVDSGIVEANFFRLPRPSHVERHSRGPLGNPLADATVGVMVHGKGELGVLGVWRSDLARERRGTRRIRWSFENRRRLGLGAGVSGGLFCFQGSVVHGGWPAPHEACSRRRSLGAR